jgi:hypothetical protein
MREAGFKPIRHVPGDNARRGYSGVAVNRPDAADWPDP